MSKANNNNANNLPEASTSANSVDPILSIDHFLANLSIETNQYQKRTNIQDLLQLNEEDSQLDRNSKIYLESIINLNSNNNGNGGNGNNGGNSKKNPFINPIKNISTPLKNITDELDLVMDSCSSPEERAKLCHQMCQDLLESSLKSEIEICNLKTELEKIFKEKELAKEAMKKSEGARNQLIDIAKELRKENIHIRAYKTTLQQIEKPLAKDDYFQKMKNDFDSLQNHFNSRGRHFNCVIKSKEIDIAILRRKLRQKELLYFQETSKVKELQELLSQSTVAELETRKQLEAYMLKFREVEDTLSRNMLLQQNFRSELDMILKKCGMLEKESKQKLGQINLNQQKLVNNEGSEEVQQKTKLDIEQLEKKCSKLEDIIKSLQEQRVKDSIIEKQKDEMILNLTKQLKSVESSKCNSCASSSNKLTNFSNGGTSLNGGSIEVKFENGGINPLALPPGMNNRKIKTPKSQFYPNDTSKH
ncbi:hypothetical protein CONCODRAFT_79221 [Conidiobolus coronatus NRRL 28638]|uniref:Uncharacterized protein n=1 Tax=Conidiobolus coronatus (strain ATCC 28846 / CBS 209.66 / NRRL 28638) TaxID=796925 RepID=A0A137P3R6_CONC2|nr:hypothetical protein CONCODRAFT_79221 [Conidiobolus coronatus NRRL 28638]|eukprot:KXN69665.1 hypothetical protein CONCODRAFT_79221 [Conidiobolus coronatus NRRL 28638]